MIDVKLLRSDPEGVARNLARRGFVLDVSALKALDERRKQAQVENDRLRAERNAHAKAVGMAKGRGEDIAPFCPRGLTGARPPTQNDHAGRRKWRARNDSNVRPSDS